MTLAAGNAIYGTIPGWLTLAAVISVLLTFIRGGAGSGEAIRSLRDARDTLTETVELQRTKLDEANKEISLLKGKTDVTLALVTALSPLTEWTGNHEARAEARHTGVMQILTLIAQRLGPEENGKDGANGA